ncbi:transposase-like protein [Paraburkholderia sp. JPY465]
MFKVPHQVYTAEFKEAAVQRVKDGQGVSAVAGELGMSIQTLRNWLKASEAGPDGQFKLLHLWAAKFPQAGRADYASDSSVTASLAAASRSR